MKDHELIMQTFIFANAIARAGKGILAPVLDKYNINLVEYYILYYLQKHPGTTQYNLLKYTTQTKSRVNQVITKLEKKGYLKKKLELVGSLLKKPLHITEAGSNIVDEGLEEMLTSTLNKLKPEERHEFELYRIEMLKIVTLMTESLNVEIPGFFFYEDDDRELIKK